MAHMNYFPKSFNFSASSPPRLGVSSTTLAPPPGSKEISMSIVVLQALLAAYAVITVGVALRMRSRARTVTLVQRDERLTVTQAAPSGPWYRVRDEQNGIEGWIHGSTIAFEPARIASSAASPNTITKVQPPAVTRPTSGRSYINVDGVRVPSPVFSDTRPAGATARCRDGSYSFSQHRRGTCSYHGGVAVWY